jgi:hypothetical protein
MAVEKMNNLVIMERQIRVSLSAAPSTMMGMPNMPNMGMPNMGMPGMGMGMSGVVPPPPAGMPPPPMALGDPQGGMHPVLDREETERSGVNMSSMDRSSLMAKLLARGGGTGSCSQ